MAHHWYEQWRSVCNYCCPLPNFDFKNAKIWTLPGCPKSYQNRYSVTTLPYSSSLLRVAVVKSCMQFTLLVFSCAYQPVWLGLQCKYRPILFSGQLSKACHTSQPNWSLVMFVCVRFGLDGSGLVTSFATGWKECLQTDLFSSRIGQYNHSSSQISSRFAVCEVEICACELSAVFRVYDSLSVLLYYIRRSKIC